jgi:hypothetical protein
LLGIGVLIIGRRTTGRWMWLRSVRGKLNSTEPTAEERRLAFIDVLGSYLFFGLGAVYIIGFVLYLIDILQLGPNSAALFFQRAVHFGSGVSPLAPLILSALGFIAWAWWHLYRVELLQCRTEFEEACTLECERGGAGADACGLVARYRAGPADEALNEPANAPAGKDQVSQWSLTQFDSRLDRLHDRRPDAGGFAIVVRLIRTRLYHLLPSETATIVLALLLLTLFWLLSQFERSIDAALPGSWLGSHGPIPPFELLLRFAVLGAICAATYALYRFVSVWRLLADLLTRIAESPLCPAFARLPAAIGQLTRLRLFPQASEALINDSIHAKWCALSAAKTLDGAPVVPEFTLQAPPNPRWTSLTLQSPNAKRGADFDVLYSSLCHVWRAEGVQPTSQRLAAKATHDTAKEPRRWASPRQKWMTAAEELVAVYVVDYIECVFKYLRGLAAFLLVALVLMTVLIVAYPFQPASVVRTMYLLIIGVSVVTLVAVLVRMNRDPVLSAIAGTNAGEVTWDARFVLNLVTFGAVPILTLLGSEFPELRGFLFSWVSPALRAFTKT